MTLHVLIIKTSSMGDVIHTLPALTDAATVLDVKFDWVVEEAFSEIPTWHPAIDQVIPVAIRRWRKTLLASNTRAEINQFLERLKAKKYAAVVDLQGLLKSAWLVRLVQAEKKCGYSLNSAREPLASLFYQHKIQISKHRHAVQRNRLLLAGALNYAQHKQLKKTPDYAIKHYFSTTSHVAKDFMAANKKHILFFHGTSRRDKYWPEERWIELAQRCAQNNYQVLLPWGSHEEFERALRIARVNAAVVVLDKMNLHNIAYLISKVEKVVSVDTGLGHLAAALGRFNVSLYGPTQVDLIGCKGVAQTHLVGANRKMECISAEQVWLALNA